MCRDREKVRRRRGGLDARRGWAGMHSGNGRACAYYKEWPNALYCTAGNAHLRSSVALVVGLDPAVGVAPLRSTLLTLSWHLGFERRKVSCRQGLRRVMVRFETEHSPGLRSPGPCQWARSASAGAIWWVRSRREPIRQRMESRSRRPQGNASTLGQPFGDFAGFRGGYEKPTCAPTHKTPYYHTLV